MNLFFCLPQQVQSLPLGRKIKTKNSLGNLIQQMILFDVMSFVDLCIINYGGDTQLRVSALGPGPCLELKPNEHVRNHVVCTIVCSAQQYQVYCM